MWQTGGDTWTRWFTSIRDDLVRTQRNDGSWPPSIDADYATALPTIVLTIPNNMVPIFQR